ncbi:hypothetical protein Tcan_14035 [Toxocara canis]|uniref:Uncharacterized protein n=1 Tax=Toxocara canis TaxID=6265 RepID=A0A0B2VM12_TOXCA|nr:hypothetical protein Tcan_14035 [Toxocara canis]
MADSNDPNYETLHGLDNKKVFVSKNSTQPQTTQDDVTRGRNTTNLEIRPPAYAAMADSNDPNYETLHGLDNKKVFVSKNSTQPQTTQDDVTRGRNTTNLEIRPPAYAAMADSNDPNYETLHGLDNKKVFVSKNSTQPQTTQDDVTRGRNTTNLEIRPPAYAAMADSNDPNYETLHGLDNKKVFVSKNSTQPQTTQDDVTRGRNTTNLEIRPPAYAAMADSNDPNYETLHGLDNKKVFVSKNSTQPQTTQDDVTRGRNTTNLEIRPPAYAAMADSNDPNYETLHGLDNKKVFVSKEASKPQTIQEETNQKQNTANLEIHPPAYAAMADSNDPNYETLHGIHNSKVFGTLTKN